eukprot:scaffold3760_cov165-Chaetoceros_neogracile.AAC.2
MTEVSWRVNLNANALSGFYSKIVTIDRTLASSDAAPRNWSSFRTDADKALEHVTKAKTFIKIFGTLGLISWFVAFWLYSYLESETIMIRWLVACAIIGVFQFMIQASARVFRKIVIPGMAKLEVVCQNHSGNGIRYVLCNIDGNTVPYFVTVTMNEDDTEGQQQVRRQIETLSEGQQQVRRQIETLLREMQAVTMNEDDTEGLQQVRRQIETLLRELQEQVVVDTAVVDTATESVPGSPWNTNPTPLSTFPLAIPDSSTSTRAVIIGGF